MIHYTDSDLLRRLDLSESGQKAGCESRDCSSARPLRQEHGDYTAVGNLPNPVVLCVLGFLKSY